MMSMSSGDEEIESRELLLSHLLHVLVLSWPTVPFDWRASSVSEECHLPLSNS
jgi:hypothetical protein